MEIIPLLLLTLICTTLLLGYPVAFTLAGVSILFALICVPFGIFDPTIFKSIPIRIFGIMNNVTLLAVPLFIFMGTILERSGIAAKMLENMAAAFRNTKGGLSISIIIVGALLAASTGIVGATVVTMGLMSLPILISQGYEKSFSTGLVASTGTLGQIIPPSIALVLLGDVMSNAYQRAQNDMGIFSQQTVTVGDLFIGAIVPGIMICVGYLIYTIYKNGKNTDLKDYSNEVPIQRIELLKTLALPIVLIFLVLGSIFAGIATPTEAAAIGAFGAMLIAFINGKINFQFIKETSEKTAIVSTMIFTILIGASIFSLINIRILKLPQTIGLMILALCLSIITTILGAIFPDFLHSVIEITKKFDFSELLVNVMLPFLLFAGAMSVNVHELLKDRLTILLLASFGVLFSTFAVGSGVFWIINQPFFGLSQMGLSYIDCLLFGALIAPTDPIAVLAMIKKMNLSTVTETRIAGESLFNDGIGVVVFLTLLAIKQDGVENVTAAAVASLFVTEVIGGIALGSLMGYFGLKLLKYIENQHTELEVLITISMVLILPIISHYFHFSAVLGVVMMGLFLNQNLDVDKKEEGVQKAMGDYVYKFWHLLDETLNAILFILIGLEIIVVFESFQFQFITVSILVIILVVLSRGVGVSIPIAILSIFKKFERKTALIITWGGLRGGLSVALALNLPDSIGEGKGLILFITYIVVLFTILVQGLTLKKIVK